MADGYNVLLHCGTKLDRVRPFSSTGTHFKTDLALRIVQYITGAPNGLVNSNTTTLEHQETKPTTHKDDPLTRRATPRPRHWAGQRKECTSSSSGGENWRAVKRTNLENGAPGGTTVAGAGEEGGQLLQGQR